MLYFFMKKVMSKSGQATIFIILGLLLVTGIGLFFAFRETIAPTGGVSPTNNPHAIFSSCIEEKVRDTIETISHQGGYMENKLSFAFQFEADPEPINISYLCYQQNYYLSCINQEPMLISHLKKEIENEIADEVEGCFNSLVSSLDKKSDKIESSYNGFSIDLTNKKILLNLDAKLSVTKGEDTSSYSGLKPIISSRFYDLAIVVQEIVSQEATYCNFEQTGYMLLYPEFDIDKFRTGDSNTIYTVRHKKTNEWFRFAVRSCVMPAGF